MYDFWLSPDISHPTGNKSDIKRERLGPNIYPLHMTQVLEKTQTEAYIDFVAKYPDIKFGQRTLDKLKPFFVRPASEKDRNTCCCRYHISSIYAPSIYYLRGCYGGCYRKLHHQTSLEVTGSCITGSDRKW